MKFYSSGAILFLILLTNIGVVYSQNNRPQDPEEPFDYISEEVFFTNFKADSIKLAGTLTLPKNVKNPPVAILISGSGPQNRNSEITQFNHRPFLILSDYLSKNGIAVLRYDDRGIAKSEGSFTTATSFDFATDVEAAFNYLKTRDDINTSKIGLIGHSEGGLIAPIVASRNEGIAYTVLLAAPGIDGGDILISQSRKALELRGTPKTVLDENDKLASIIYTVIKTETDNDIIKTKITNELNTYKANNPTSALAPVITPQFIQQQLGVLKSPWLLEFIRIEPKDYLEKTSCSVLALNGSKDVQVLPKINLENIKLAFEKGRNKDFTIEELEGLNHLFQTAETGNVDEYKMIEETFSPSALSIIKDWILERF